MLPLRAGAALLLAVLLLLIGPGPADAAPKRTVTVKVTAPSGVASSPLTLAGRVTRSPKGSKLVVQRRAGSTWVKVASARTTTKAGAFAVRLVRPAVAGTYLYRVQASKKGKKLKAAVSAPVTVTSLAKVAVSLTATPSSVPVGQQTTLEGSVAPFAVGTTVTVQRQQGASWVPVTTTTLSAGGAFSVPVTVTADATYRVAVPAGGVRLAAVSPSRAVTAVPVTPTIATTRLADGIVGKAYVQQLAAVGSPAGTWSVDQLPAGLQLAPATGLISGTPTAATTTSVTVGFVQTANSAAAPAQVLTLRVDPVAVPPATAQLSGGGQHACRVGTDHTIDCWGSNFAQQLGQPLVLQTPRNPTPTQVGTATDWVEVSAGGSSQWAHSCGIRTDRSLWCWGSNVDGELGQPGAGTEYVPKRVDVGRNWATVASGWAHTCAVSTDGQLWCWGSNVFGQLGRPGDAAPARVGTRSDWKSVSAGYTHTCATTTGGQLWCWGMNSRGQLGDGTTGSSAVPVRESGDGTTWASVSVGGSTSCALRTDSSLWCWGYNAHGETGTGNPGTDRLAPTRVGTASDWESVSATGYSGQGNHACAVNTGGQLWCWGHNGNGELGTGDTNDAAVPVRVGTGTDWSAVASGGNATYAVKDDGSQWAWGNNFEGQLGTGSVNAGSPTPVAVLP